MGGNAFLANTASGNLTLNNGASVTSTATGNAIVVAAGSNFINNSGSSTPFSAADGRWIGYSNKQTSDTNSLSPTQTINGYTIATLPPGSVPNSGQTSWIYDVGTGTITITTLSTSTTYGTAPSFSYSFACSDGCSSSHLTGAPSFSTNATTSTSGNANAGTWTITASGASDDNGYTINYVDTGILTLNTKALSITGLSGTNKVYDSLTSDPVTGTAALSGVVAGLNNGGGTSDVVTLSNGSASFADPNVGTGKAVTFSGYSISGADAADYALSQPATSTANITAAGLTVTASNQNKTYGFGGTSAALGTTAFSVVGLQGTDAIDTATLSTNASLSGSSNYNAGTWTLTPSAAHFSSGLSSNYSITYDNATVGLTIAQKALSITGVSGTNKVYDSLTSDPVTGTASLSGNISGDTVNLSAGSASFADPNVGTGKTVTFTGYSINGADAADYALSQPASSTANITAAGLTVTASNQSKTYGFGGTSAALGTTAFSVVGLQGTDAIDTAALATNASLSGSSNYNAGTWTLTPSAAHFSSGLGSNYTITYDNASVGLTIAQKALSITGLSGTNKVYDSLTSDPVTGTASLSGNISGDTVNLSAGSASFADPNVGTGKAVTFSGYSVSGSDAANYTLSQPATSTANITAAGLTVTADNKAKTYGTSDPTFTYSLSGLQGSDSAGSVLSGSLTRDPGENVGNYSITQGTLASNSNYTISYVPGTMTITTANILAVAADDKTMIYGSSVPTLTYTYSGLVNGDTNSVFSGALATTATSGSNVGSYNITQGTLSAGINYSINFTSGTLSVTPATLSVTANSSQHKTYGASDPALTYGYSGLVNGDTSSVFSGSLTRVAGENVGTYAIGQGGLSGGINYTISYTSSNFSITPAALTVTASNQNKTYGFGGTSAALSTTAFTVSGLQGSDAIDTATLATNASLSGSSNYNAGTWTLTPTAAHFSSGLSSNYSITYDNANVGLTIAQKALSITGLSGTNKVYDATTSDPITGTAALSGNISGDTVNLANGAAAFGDPNVGTGKTVTFSGYAISGADAADYALSQPANSSANITQANLTVTAENKASTYGEAIPTLTATITGFVGAQTLGTSGVTGNASLSTSATSSSNAGNYVISAALGSLSAGNYDFTTFNNGTLTINPAGAPHASGPAPIPSSFLNLEIVITDGTSPILCVGGKQSRQSYICDVASNRYLSRPRTFANKNSLAGNTAYVSNGYGRGDASDLSSSTGDDRNPGF